MQRPHRILALALKGGSLPVLELPLDRPRPPCAPSIRRASSTCSASDLVDVPAHASSTRASGVSLFSTMLSGFAATLHRLTAHEDMVIGIPALPASCPATCPALVGHCVNLLPTAYRHSIRPCAVRRADGAMQHRRARRLRPPGAHLRRAAGPAVAAARPEPAAAGKRGRSTSTPTWRAAHRHSTTLDGRAGHDRPPATRTSNCSSTCARSMAVCKWRFSTTPTCSTRCSVQRWLGMFECVLRSVLHEPDETVGRLEVLSSTAARSLLALQPARVPLVGEPLAHAGFLRTRAAATQPPGVCATARAAAATASSTRSPTAWRVHCACAAWAAASAWGCAWSAAWRWSSRCSALLKAGASYVPLDPAFPQARLDHYATDAQPQPDADHVGHRGGAARLACRRGPAGLRDRPRHRLAQAVRRCAAAEHRRPRGPKTPPM